MTENPQKRWTDGFKQLSGLSVDDRDRLLARSRILEIGKGSKIFGPGQEPKNLLLLMAGTIRVQQLSETGREVTLYRVSAGESCVMTTSFILALENYRPGSRVEDPARLPEARLDRTDPRRDQDRRARGSGDAGTFLIRW